MTILKYLLHNQKGQIIVSTIFVYILFNSSYLEVDNPSIKLMTFFCRQATIHSLHFILIIISHCGKNKVPFYPLRYFVVNLLQLTLSFSDISIISWGKNTFCLVKKARGLISSCL